MKSADGNQHSDKNSDKCGIMPERPRMSEPKPNPYEVPLTSVTEPPRPSNAKDPSVTAEPWFNQTEFFSAADPHAAMDNPSTWGSQARQLAEHELAEHSVWDEPATSTQLLSGADAMDDSNAVTWFRYYQKQAATTPALVTWLVTGLIVLLAGPLAILGAIINGFGGDAFLMLVFFGPTIEEVLKIALPLWVVEKRPWLFSNHFQILLCGLGAGLAFAVIENLIYLNLYFPNASPPLIAWRWSVCVALHTGCSAIAAGGLIQVRRGMLRRGHQPHLYDGGRWIIAAIVIHGIYNLFAIFLSGWMT